MSGDNTQRDNLGRITHKTESINGESITYAYTYDAADRLQDVMLYQNDNLNPSTWYEYEYDNDTLPVGNKGRVTVLTF